jgi:hypothetical protein
LCPIFKLIFFHFQPLTISLLKFEFHNLFWFDFYKVITTSWSWSRVWQINSSWFELFFCLFFMRLSRSHDPVHGFVRLTYVKFFCYFLINFINFIFQHWMYWELNFIIYFDLFYMRGYHDLIIQIKNLVG